MSEQKIHKKNSPWLIQLLSGKFLQNDWIRTNLAYLSFIYVLILVYIGIGYYAEGLVKKISKSEQEIKDLRSEYISVKSELMVKSKQSTVAKAMELYQTNIKETIIPPKKIVVQTNE